MMVTSLDSSETANKIVMVLRKPVVLAPRKSSGLAVPRYGKVSKERQ